MHNIAHRVAGTWRRLRLDNGVLVVVGLALPPTLGALSGGVFAEQSRPLRNL